MERPLRISGYERHASACRSLHLRSTTPLAPPTPPLHPPPAPPYRRAPTVEAEGPPDPANLGCCTSPHERGQSGSGLAGSSSQWLPVTDDGGVVRDSGY